MSTPSSSVARRRACPPSALPEALRVVIGRVGHLGDGVGIASDGRTVCVPYTLPGEVVIAALNGQRGSVALARAQGWASSSPDRVAPPCPHFGACGGCALQHWDEAAYLAWKTGLLREALRGAGYIDPPVRPIAAGSRYARRRIDFAFKRSGRSVTLGLHRAGGDDIVDIAACVVLHPMLLAILAPLRTLLARLAAAGGSGAVIINLLDSGLDIVIRGKDEPGTAARALIVDFARTNGVARVHWARGAEAPETVCMLDRATIRFADVEVAVPPDAFLQATRPGEAAIVAAVIEGLPGPARGGIKVLELYAGCGTLTFPLAHRARVSAFEGNLAAWMALRSAADRALPGRIGCHHRDLVRRPLGRSELSGYDVVVLDPPWQGAAVQVCEVAGSKINRVIYVSCNPTALRRDAEVLHNAGFALDAATPIDQFLWSAQLESVVVFSR